MTTVDKLKQEMASLSSQSGSINSATELDEFLSSSAGDKRILVCTATANPSQVQYTWTIRDSGRQNDTPTTSPSSTTSDSPATERVITVAIGSSSNNGLFELQDNLNNLNRSILILQDRLEVSDNDDGNNDNDNRQNGGASEGVRTYVCTVNNTVGWDQCITQVQGKKKNNIFFFWITN